MRVEYFRGQDFVAYVEAHPGLFNVFAKGAAGRPAGQACLAREG